jgi:hypothetical protein
MSEVVLEVLGVDGWVMVGGVGEAEPPGSISSESGFDRQVYVFGWIDGAPGVWRSEFGFCRIWINRWSWRGAQLSTG